MGLLAQVHRHRIGGCACATRLDPVWVEMPLTILSWFLPGSAVVVGVLGQIALAAVLMLVALGLWLRLWRGRRQRRT